MAYLLLLLTVVFVAFSAGGSFLPTFRFTLCEVQQTQIDKYVQLLHGWYGKALDLAETSA